LDRPSGLSVIEPAHKLCVCLQRCPLSRAFIEKLIREGPRVYETDGRYLADFRYACVGYSMYLDDKETPTGMRDKARAQLPVCAGVEVISA